MSWAVSVAKRARRALLDIPEPDRRRIAQALAEMMTDPRGGDFKKLKGKSDLYRRRVGDWRIFLRLDARNRTVDVADIQRRSSTTY